jgi:hypothetical protein
MTNATFQVGNTYKMLWIGDADAATPCKVLKRSKKFVTFELPGFGVKRVGVKVDFNGSEYAQPIGRYSMAPQVTANRLMA